MVKIEKRLQMKDQKRVNMNNKGYYYWGLNAG
jgi:hypothetical protein